MVATQWPFRAVLLSSFLVVASFSSAQTKYRMEVIPSAGLLPGSSAYDLGDNGYVAMGWGVYHSGAVQTSGQIGGQNVSVVAVNGSGQGVGEYASGYLPRFGTTYSAATWENGIPRNLGTPGQTTFATSIANNGTILGQTVYYERTGSYSRGWVLKDGAYTMLQPSSGNAYSENRGNAINASGVVVGSAEGPNGNYEFRAARWVNNVHQSLGTGDPRYKQSSATGVSDAGDILFTGFRSYFDGGNDYSAFIWSNGTVKPLPTFGGTRTHASSMSSNGHVVGMAEDLAGNYRSFLWTGSGALDSLDHVLDGTVYRDFLPGDINAQGQILGTAFRTEFDGGTTAWSILLTPQPVPEPTVVVALGSGVVALVRRRRR